MKYVWEEKDIRSGRQARSILPEKFDVHICYMHTGNAELSYGICHTGSDGLVLTLGGKDDVARHLNRYSYVPVNVE